MLDATGGTLFLRRFDAVGLGEAGNVAAFGEKIPVQQGAAAVSLRKDGVELASVSVSPGMPTVTITSPNGGESLSGEHTVTWTATDPDQDTLSFDVLTCRWRWMDKPGSQWHDEVFELSDRDAWYIRQANIFLDTIEGKCPPPCTLEEGFQTLKVALAALAAVKHGPNWQTIS